MPLSEKRQIKCSLFQFILEEEKMTDWKVLEIHSGGGLTLLKHKEIWLDTRNINVPFFLHELTHAKGYTGHNGIWADKYTALLVKYLGGEADYEIL